MMIELQFPIEYGDETIEWVELKRLTIGDVVKITASTENQVDMSICIMAASAGLPADMIKLMDLADFVRMSQELASVLGIDPEELFN